MARPGMSDPVSRPAKMSGPSVVPQARAKKPALSNVVKGQVVQKQLPPQWGSNPKFSSTYYRGE